MHIVVFLQNAWSPLYAGEIWPRESWLRALWASRSGAMLAVMHAVIEDAEHTVWYDNVTPMVSITSRMCLPPDKRHVWSVLNAQWPDMVVACGKSAAQALKEMWPWGLTIVPHPAYRVGTVELWRTIGQVVAASGSQTRQCITQGRASIGIQPLGG